MTLRTMLGRVMRLRCPACGHGHLFRRYFVRKDRCGHCGWTFEREEGHWVGGSEVHMFASYGLSVLLFVPILILMTPTPAMLAAVIAGHVALSLLLFRFSRAFFLGVDFMLDPAKPGDDDDGGGGLFVISPPDRPAGERQQRITASVTSSLGGKPSEWP